MILNSNAFERTDLGKNYIRKNRETSLPVINNVVKFHEKSKENPKVTKDKIFERIVKKKRYPGNYNFHKKKITRGIKHPKVFRRSNQFIRNPIMIATGSSNTGNQVANSSKSLPGNWKNTISKNSLFLIIALGIVVVFIFGIVFLILRKLSKKSSCSGKQSDLICPGNTITEEKGLQCIHCFEDDDEDFETQSNIVSQITEIDVEGGSCFNSVGIDTRKSFSDTVLFRERIITPKVSIEKLKLVNVEEPVIEVSEDQSLPPSSCRCRSLENNICGSKPKKKKKKTKVKSKDENKSTKNYLKAMQDKILPRQRRHIKKDCNFDTKHLQDKIITILNQECGACRCCDCSKDNNYKSVRSEEKVSMRSDKKEPKKKHSKRDKCEKLSVTKGDEKELVVTNYQASVSSRSPLFSDRRSFRKEESNIGKKSKIKNREKSIRRKDKAKDNRIVLSTSSDSDRDNYDNEKRRKLKSNKRSKRFF